jgi:hypothetical protein
MDKLTDEVIKAGLYFPDSDPARPEYDKINAETI